jgi:hypothetical protein
VRRTLPDDDIPASILKPAALSDGYTTKGKACNPHEFGVKVSLEVNHQQGQMVGARSFPGAPDDGHVLSAQLEETSNLLQDLGRSSSSRCPVRGSGA